LETVILESTYSVVSLHPSTLTVRLIFPGKSLIQSLSVRSWVRRAFRLSSSSSSKLALATTGFAGYAGAGYGAYGLAYYAAERI